MARVLAVLLALCAVLSGIALASDLAEYRILDALVGDPLALSPDEVAASDLRQVVVASSQALLLLATGIAFIVWSRRMYGNLVPLGARDLRWSPGWAIGGWFVPVLNLWRPKQIVNDVWRASHPDLSRGSADWHGHRVPAWLTLWWLLFLASGTMSTSAASASLGETPEELRAAALRFVITDGIDIVAAVLAIWVVLSLTARQEERALRQGRAATVAPAAGRTSFTLATAAVSLALAAVGFLAFEPGITPSGVPTASRGADGDVATRGVVPIEDLRPGDCFEEPSAAEETQQIFGIELVPCDEPHGFEVFAAPQLPGAAGAPFPGDDDAFEQALVLCDEAFVTTIAVGPETPVLDLYVINPSPDSWAAGDREVLCAVYRLDGARLDGPVERIGQA